MRACVRVRACVCVCQVHANEGQCDNVTEMFMACSYSIDGDYMFGVTVRLTSPHTPSLLRD